MVTILPAEERSKGRRPLVSSREPKKFTSMQMRNLHSGESSASAMVSLNPALFTKPQSPAEDNVGKKGIRTMTPDATLSF